MANIVKIKRGEGVPTTSDLKYDGELGYDKQTNKLYINRDNTILEINQFEIGGRNYLRDSGITVASTGSYILPIYGYAAPLVGEDVVFSFDMMTHADGALRNIQVYSYQESGVTIASSPVLQALNTGFEKWERFSLSTSIQEYPIPEGFTPGAIGFYDAGGDNSFSLRNFKLEKGNVATDWTPALEDIDAKFSEQDILLGDLTTISQTNSTLISQTNEEITSLVSQETYQTSLDDLQTHLEGYVSGEVDTQITNYSSEVNQKFDSVTTTFTEVTTEIGDLGNTLQTSLDEISTYIRFSIDGIELGESKNPINLLIQNDKIVFKQNDIEVAYIDNNKLYITDGEFLNSLRLGNFAFIPRDNGNLSFGKVT